MFLIKVIVWPESFGMSDQAPFERRDIAALTARALVNVRPSRGTKEGLRA